MRVLDTTSALTPRKFLERARPTKTLTWDEPQISGWLFGTAQVPEPQRTWRASKRKSLPLIQMTQLVFSATPQVKSASSEFLSHFTNHQTPKSPPALVATSPVD